MPTSSSIHRFAPSFLTAVGCIIVISNWPAAAAGKSHDATTTALGIHLEKALSYDLEGNVDGALFELRRAIQLDPHCLQAHASLGALLLTEVGDVDGAISEDVTALGIDPGSTLCQQQLNEALAASHSVVEKDLDQANALYRAGSLWRAAAGFRIACYVDPKSAEAHNSLSWTLYRLGKLDEASTEVKRALELAPDDAEYINTLACILFDKGQIEDALKEFQRAIAKSKQVNPADLYGLAVGFLSTGKQDSAVESFKKALKEDPNYADASYLRDRVGMSANTLASHEQLLTLSGTKSSDGLDSK
jgi:Tfp pilus assembly protein PilF